MTEVSSALHFLVVSGKWSNRVAAAFLKHLVSQYAVTRSSKHWGAAAQCNAL